MCDDQTSQIEAERKRKSAYSLAWYHKNKSKKGIKDFQPKTKEEKCQVQRDGERRRYREERAKLGLTVKEKNTIPLTDEQKKLNNLESCRKYRERNKDKVRKASRKWAADNREKTIARWVERYHTEPAFNLAIKIRRRIHMALRGAKNSISKVDTNIKLLGCSYAEFKTYTESKFTDGMTWDKCFNGEIHLDHILPCSHFDLLNEDDQRKCFHYSNIQPLWASDNLQKHDKILTK